MRRNNRTPSNADRVRDNILDDAIRAGKIAAARREEYGRMYDADPVSIRRLLTAKVEEGGLMPGLVGPGEDLTTAPGPSDYDESWLSPIERERIAGARGGSRPAPTAPSQPQAPRASSTPAQSTDDEYDATWLSGEERERIAAAKEGRLTHYRIQFEDADARRAAGAAAADR